MCLCLCVSLYVFMYYIIMYFIYLVYIHRLMRVKGSYVMGLQSCGVKATLAAELPLTVPNKD